MKTIRILFVLCFIFFCNGCGRVSVPQSPDDSFYPHVYYVKDNTQSPQEESSKGEAEELAKDYADSIFD